MRASFGRILTALALAFLCLLGACGKGEEKALLEKAMTAFDQGRIADSLAALDDFLIRYPDSPLAQEALYQRGVMVSLHRESYRDAVDDFREVVRRWPQGTRAMESQRRIAEICERNLDDPVLAVEEYKKFLAAFPDDPGADEIQFRIAGLLFHLMRFEDARSGYAALAERYPRSPLADSAAFQTALSWGTEGRLDRAEEAWRLFLERFPENPLLDEARFHLASILEEEGKLEEAQSLFSALLSVHPNPGVVKLRLDKVRERMARRGR